MEDTVSDEERGDDEDVAGIHIHVHFAFCELTNCDCADHPTQCTHSTK